jgi:hypothetical protein
MAALLGIGQCVEQITQKIFQEARDALMSSDTAQALMNSLNALKETLKSALSDMLPDMIEKLPSFAAELIGLKSLPASEFLEASKAFIKRWEGVVTNVQEIIHAIENFNICSVSNVYAEKVSAAGVVTQKQVKAFETQMPCGLPPEPVEKVETIKGDDKMDAVIEISAPYGVFQYELLKKIQSIRPTSTSTAVSSAKRSIADAASLKKMPEKQFLREFGSTIAPATLAEYTSSEESKYETQRLNSVGGSLLTISNAYVSKLGKTSPTSTEGPTLRSEYDASIKSYRDSLTDNASIEAVDKVSADIGNLIEANAENIRLEREFTMDGPGVLPPRDDPGAEPSAPTEGDLLLGPAYDLPQP